MQNHSGGDTDRVASGILSLFPWDLGPRQYLSREKLGVKTSLTN